MLTSSRMMFSIHSVTMVRFRGKESSWLIQVWYLGCPLSVTTSALRSGLKVIFTYSPQQYQSAATDQLRAF